MLNDLYKKIAKKPTALEQHKLNIEQPFKNVDEIMNITSTKKQSTGKKKLRLGIQEATTMGVLVKQKKIVINTKGRLALKGNVMGPIDIPYYEDCDIIGRMLVSCYKVNEVLTDGSQIILTLNNYKTTFPNSYERVVVKSFTSQMFKTNNNRNVQDNTQVTGSGEFHKIVVDARTKEIK